MSNPHIQSGRNALKQADRAARRGDLAAAERWSKAAERCAEAAARFADTNEFDKAAFAEEVRAEMLTRLHRLVAAYRDDASVDDLRRMEREMA